jgi:hypothetical protein
MHTRSKQLGRLGLPLIAGLAMLCTSVVAGPALPARADSPGYSVIAFQDNDQNLWVYTSAGAKDSGLGMAAYTSPAVVFADDELEIAFESSAGVLEGYWPATNSTYVTNLVMGNGNSPSISQTFEVAFSGTDYDLMLASIGVSSQNTGLEMAPGTSPSISADGKQVAFQGADGNLWVYNVPFNTYVDTGLAMATETSPAIGYDSDGSEPYVVVFHDSDGNLWYYDLGIGAHNTGLGMAASASPTVDPDYSQEVAFDSSAGYLWTYNAASGSGHDTGLAMEGGKLTPSIGGYYNPSGEVVGYQVAFLAWNGLLNTYNTEDNSNATNTDIAPEIDTNPSYSPGVEVDIGD